MFTEAKHWITVLQECTDSMSASDETERNFEDWLDAHGDEEFYRINPESYL